jgi:2-polyprenyl-3-methyl-5-hydroxy-6-metoxy-1,4-benzoquinol methylase
VLDIATGPGYIAEAFARNSREVLGMDLTEAMLDIARARTKERGVKNISFRTGDAQNLPFGEGEFDVVVCRLALHHVQQPAKVVSGMTRVCRAGGTVLVEDIYGSEHSARAAYQDCWEILRDPSHVRALPLSELLHIFRDAGLETETVSTADDLCPEVERWMATTKNPAISRCRGADVFSCAHGDSFGTEERCLTPRSAEGQLIQSKAHTFVLSLIGYCGADGIPILCLKLSGNRVRRGF